MTSTRTTWSKIGEHIEALVLQKEDKEGRLILSKKRAQYERAWGTIEKIKEEDGVVTGTVIEVVKGGLILDIGLRGFLPASLVEMRRVRDLQPYVGKEIEAKIIELDKNRNNVVLSRRAWLEQTQSEVRHTFLNTLSKGQIRKGVVSSIVNFGAFVDLGGVDGLVHVSELSWKHIDHPGEVVEVGQEVTVEVLDVDMDRERVSLSLKSTQEDPWQQFARTHQIGQVVPGRVTKLVPFGAFVRVEEGIEGLVHISELADRHVEIPEQVVQVGDEIFVKIIDIDLDRRRISLSLKQANEGTIGEAVGDDFDPTLYGMPASYDEQGNYEYPEGFDPETGEWLPGYEKQREEWEHQYAEARARFEAHRRQVEESRKAADEEEARPRPSPATPARRRATARRAARAAPARADPARRCGTPGRGHLELDAGDRGHRHPGLRRGPGGPAREAVRRPELERSTESGARMAGAAFCAWPRPVCCVTGTSNGRRVAVLRVGLTGGIGSGKSEVSRRLADHGAVLIDADVAARAGGRPRLAGAGHGSPAAFGDEVLRPDGSLNRERLGEIVFADPGLRAKLNEIVHPLVRAWMQAAERTAVQAAGPPGPVIVHDVPLLAESRGKDGFDLVIVVDVPPELQVERLVSQRGMAPDQARARMAAQASREQRLAVADIVIDNSGSLDDLDRRVAEVWAGLVRRLQA